MVWGVDSLLFIKIYKRCVERVIVWFVEHPDIWDHMKRNSHRNLVKKRKSGK